MISEYRFISLCYLLLCTLLASLFAQRNSQKTEAWPEYFLRKLNCHYLMGTATSRREQDSLEPRIETLFRNEGTDTILTNTGAHFN